MNNKATSLKFQKNELNKQIINSFNVNKVQLHAESELINYEKSNISYLNENDTKHKFITIDLIYDKYFKIY